ncbi:molybdate ABC transporter substrate-binding protein [Arthrobacter sp. VKM Ac-2550]|uniref:molybdate ABC transporter substrate-binding protein n=1 Tax=Crystallibacter permensis TaxID=1938888 RepID=UPI002226B7B2|nr:molybdate ABC transporter substrate-binding protein [Arthrobacter sp. VKM Ac-2550]MCW2133571.1 molybdate transport system substrate-binding protein [Arthrobacter sp. VKM Ac-2550]
MRRAVQRGGRLAARPRRLAATLLALAGTMGLAACGSGGAAEGTITVYAAASLAAPFTALAESFEAQAPGSTVRLNFAGSADLAAQILEGAPADVFASADAATLARVEEAGGVAGSVQKLATNIPALVVPAANPAGIETLADLERPDVKLVLCAPQVPCGAAARELAEAGGVRLAPVSEENSVTAVLGKVTAGEADAGFVYRTDAVRAGNEVRTIPVPHAGEAAVTYPIAVTAGAAGTGREELAREFVEYVTGEQGQRVLTDAGFGRP